MGRPRIRELGGKCKYEHPLNSTNAAVIHRSDRKNPRILCLACQAIWACNYDRRKRGRPEVPMIRKTFEQWASERKQVW